MRKNNKKNKKKELSSLILLLFLTVVLLTTSTYAWFTSNRTVKIDSLTVNVAASNGLLISSNAADGSWKTLIQKADLLAGYTVSDSNDQNPISALNQLPGTLVPVSTVNVVQNGYLSMFKGTLENDLLTAVASPETAGITGDFISFDVFLKLDTASNVYLSVGSGVTADAESASRGLHYATRMAIINEGTKPATSTQYEIVGQKGGTTAVIIEPNADAHTNYGIQNAAYYQDYTYADGDYTKLKPGTENGLVSWDGLKSVITTGVNISNTNATDTSSYFSNVAPTITTNVSFSQTDSTDKPKLIFTNLAAGVTKLHIYMWVEGQDIDCQNNASGSDLTYNLSFTLDSGV